MIPTRLFYPLALVASLFLPSTFAQTANVPTALAGLDLCGQASVSLAGINIVNGLCLCVANRELTPASLVAINSTLTARGGVLGGLVNGAGSLLSSVFLTTSTLSPVLGGQQINGCTLPANSVQDSCTDCSFTCTTGFYQCGQLCIPTTQGCISGMPQRKRDITKVPVELRCPRRQSACMLPSAKIFDGTNYECIDTRDNIESCGGCEYPLPGQPRGQDCTAISNVDSVACVNNKCVVSSCQSGFAPSGNECVKSTSDYVAESLAFVDAAFNVANRPIGRRSRRSTRAWSGLEARRV